MSRTTALVAAGVFSVLVIVALCVPGPSWGGYYPHTWFHTHSTVVVHDHHTTVINRRPVVGRRTTTTRTRTVVTRSRTTVSRSR